MTPHMGSATMEGRAEMGHAVLPEQLGGVGHRILVLGFPGSLAPFEEGKPIGQEGAWAIRLHYKPLVRWMWLGAILMAVGGFTTVADKRYRRQRGRVSAGLAAEVA